MLSHLSADPLPLVVPIGYRQVRRIVELCLPGGSGYGDPVERSIEAVGLDLRDGYITAEGATSRYCCSVDDQGEIDVDKTAVLRNGNGRDRNSA